MSMYISVLIIAAALYAVRLLPFVFIRGKIKNPFIRSFLYYVPYVTLAVMTFPAILYSSDVMAAGAAALLVGAASAYFTENLFLTAVLCSLTVYIAGLF